MGTKPDMADLAGALQHIWAGHGIDVAVDIAPSSIDAERVARSQVPMFRKSWLADYPDAENFLSLFMPDRWCPNGPNYTHYANAEVTGLLVRAAAMVPGQEREALLRGHGPDELFLTCGAGVVVGIWLFNVRGLPPLGLSLCSVGVEPAHRSALRCSR